MENCSYTAIKIENRESNTRGSRKFLARQIFVCTGIWACYFCYGLSAGSPTVLIAQIRRAANSSDVISMETESWLSSTYNYSGFVSAVILAFLSRYFGRKLLFLMVGVISLIGYIIFYFSNTVAHILISEIILGPLAACQVTISIIVLTEYTSPKYRGVFLTIKSATFFWGIWVANTIGTFLHWKIIGVLAFVCLLCSTLTTAFWPESPYWLASKSRFEDCAASHRWLKGNGKESEVELETLIQSKLNSQRTANKNRSNFKGIINIMSRRTFYKPISLVLLLFALYNFTGKLACAMYSLNIIKRITKTESTAYKVMLILDGISVLGMYVGCGLSKVLKRKTLLVVTSLLGTLFLFLISLYLYLINLDVIAENNITTISLLLIYSLTVSMGPMIICTTIVGEIISIKFRNLSILFVGCFAQVLMATILKICPFIISYSGTHGLFLFFATNTLSCTVAAYIFIPETKDKTLLEIQQCILGTETENVF